MNSLALMLMFMLKMAHISFHEPKTVLVRGCLSRLREAEMGLVSLSFFRSVEWERGKENMVITKFIHAGTGRQLQIPRAGAGVGVIGS